MEKNQSISPKKEIKYKKIAILPSVKENTDKNSQKIKLIHSYFTIKKEKTNPYFLNAKVGSCSHIIVKNNSCLAIPFRIKNERGRCLNYYKFIPEKLAVNRSTYINDYIPVANMHCGMLKKPLVPYDPESLRNRLPIISIVSGAAANRSSLDLGNREGKLLDSKKQWKTTYRDCFKKPHVVPVTNAGISSDLAKASRRRLNASM